MIGMSLSAS
jgi:hemA: glutamyl-tRNA reductase